MSKRIVFQHLRNTANIGDRWCCPFDWFDWPDQSEVRDIRDLGSEYDVGIYGGGKIFGALAMKTNGVVDAPNTTHIAWGVSTVQRIPISLRYSRSRRLCKIVGSRDFNNLRHRWVPCASVMAPFFDQEIDPEHDVVFYFHAQKTENQKINIPSQMPKRSNCEGKLQEALSFIASGETVVTNSYHGVYWALVMGRKVIAIPFSKKFSYYRLPPRYASPRNWEKALIHGVAQPEMKELCRTQTIKFRDRVYRELERIDGTLT